MRVDLEYYRNLLDVFLEAKTAHITFQDIMQAGIEIITPSKDMNQEFLFHYQLLADNGLISNQSLSGGTMSELGISQTLGGSYRLVNIPLRLTQQGHDFAKTLNNKEVFEKLQSELKDAPFKVVFEGGQKLLQHIFMKKLDSLLE